LNKLQSDEVEEFERELLKPSLSGVEVLSVFWGLGKVREDGGQDECFILSKSLEQRTVENFIRKKMEPLGFSEIETSLILHSVGNDWKLQC
jgi:hypothetical protein